MKLGVCLELFFGEYPFVERIARAADAGYRFAEMWLIDGTLSPSGIDPRDRKDAAKVRQAAEKAGVTLMSAVIGSPDGALGGGLTDPRHRAEWLKRTNATLAFCAVAGVGACIACPGNVIPGRSPRAMRRSVIDGLKATAERAETEGIDIWLEPLNARVDHLNCFCTGSDQAADIIRAVGSERVRLLYDCYHMQIMEGDLIGHIRRNLDAIANIHVAGYPGRGEPWTGETNYPWLLKEAQAMGYQGVFTMEYQPRGDAAASLVASRAYLETGRAPA